MDPIEIQGHCLRFGEKLRRIRREVGISMETLGNRAGLHRTEIGHLEHARREPRLTTIFRVAHALDMSASRLLEDVDRLEGDENSDLQPLVAVRGPRRRPQGGEEDPARAGSSTTCLGPRRTTKATEDRSGPDSASIDSGADAELPRCIECGRELVDVESDGDAAPIREDCVPETGPGSPYADRLSINLRQLRVGAGLERSELETRAAAHYISKLEGDDAHNLRLTTALRLAHSLRASIEQLTDRIYWTPGQVVHGSEHPPVERLPGFLQVLPGNESPFESPPLRDPVVGRQEAAAIFGANVSEARERRRLTQAQLARRAGVGKNGLSLIKRGNTETSVKLLLALARSLEVPPDLLLGDITWSPVSRPPGSGRPGCSRDIAIRRL